MHRPLFSKCLSAAFVLGVGALVGGMMPIIGSQVAPGGTVVAASVVAPDSCADAVYPYLPAACLTRADGGTVEDVRWVTIETRLGDNVSALTTTPVLD